MTAEFPLVERDRLNKRMVGAGSGTSCVEFLYLSVEEYGRGCYEVRFHTWHHYRYPDLRV